MLHDVKLPAAYARRLYTGYLGLFLTGIFLLNVHGCTQKSEAQQNDSDTGVTMPEEGVPMEDEQAAVVMGPEDADHFWVFAESKDELGTGGEFHVYVDPERYPDALASFAKYGVGVGGALPVHRHDKTEEIAYFLSGEGVVQIFENGSPRDVPVRSGHVWYTPPGAWHAVRNTGDEPLTLIFATIPNEKQGLLSFFRRIGTKPGVEGTPLSPEDFSRLATEHDLILKPPSTDESSSSSR